MKIETPRGNITIAPNGRAQLEWNPDFVPDYAGRFSRAQKYIDSEVLRLSVPYLPFQSGMLEKSGILGTIIGSGEVTYDSPYARFLHEGKVMVGIQSRSAWAKPGERKVTTNKDLTYHGAPQRGPRWFERMKADHGRDILNGAAEITRRER